MKIQENYFYKLDNLKNVKVIWKKYDKANILELGIDYPTAIVDLDRFSGIPLTEDWLLKFGFKKSNNNTGFQTFDKDRLSIHLRSKQYINGRVYFNSWCIFENQIENVHQLQGLFYSLIGKELVVSAVS